MRVKNEIGTVVEHICDIKQVVRRSLNYKRGGWYRSKVYFMHQRNQRNTIRRDAIKRRFRYRNGRFSSRGVTPSRRFGAIWTRNEAADSVQSVQRVYFMHQRNINKAGMPSPLSSNPYTSKDASVKIRRDLGQPVCARNAWERG